MVEQQSAEKQKQQEESKAKAAAEKGHFREPSDRPANAVMTPPSEYEYGYEYYEEGENDAETPADRRNQNQMHSHSHVITNNTGRTPADPRQPKSEYEYGYEYYGELSASKQDINSGGRLQQAASEGEEYKDDEYDEVEDGVDLQEGDVQGHEGVLIDGKVPDVAVFSNLPASSADMVS